MHGTTLSRFTISAAVAAILLLTGCAAQATAPRKTLQAFASDREISELFRRWADEARERGARRERAQTLQGLGMADALMSAQPAAKAAAAESITNVQHAGVDEGGIVKQHGDHLVILRRGRLFTVQIGDRDLKPVSMVNAYGDGIDPRGAWYDELLVSGDTVVVIGYSYARGGTEVGSFSISSAGELRHRGTLHLRSNDYYSSRNYASRLIGSMLVLYTPLALNPLASDPFASFPAMRHWRPGATAAEFRRIAPATRIYRAAGDLDPAQGVALHTVTACDLAASRIDCRSTAVLGAPGRVFYVSGSSVYVWTTAWRRGHAHDGSAVFRMPLDGAAPTALRVAGSPLDQFSFLEADDHLNVLVRAHGRGDGMWAAEGRAGGMALLRVALSDFSDGSERVPPAAYRPLPRPAGQAVQNRYIGPYLLYGGGAGWHRPRALLQAPLHLVRYAEDGPAREITLAHGVDRIEALGADAVVVGTDGRHLHFTTLRLAAGEPAAVDRYTRPNAAQGETRSHGFFYRREAGDAGVIGLPVIGAGQGAGRQLRRESAAVLFLRNQALRLDELGALDSRREANLRDGCQASCVDWYGNSRPLFVRGRVFALMGYEIVEGRIAGAGIAEVGRISFAPREFRPES